MPVYFDQMNRAVEISATPKRIISIVPSQTELLFDLGLDDQIVGITQFCVHPADKVKHKTIVGGTKKLNIGLIKELAPDLIIGNKEENLQEQIEELMPLFPVWMSDVSDLPAALDMIVKIGEINGKSDEAAVLSGSINAGFKKLDPMPEALRVVYFIWRKPYMVAGKGTFIGDMLQKCGVTNAFGAERYPEITAEQLIGSRPQVVLLSSEPYPFREKHIAEFKALLPDASIKVVDGEMFSWFGSRLLKVPEYFDGLIREFKD